ncbi:hypothetical protein HDU76_007761, partial [Blyttiomyces sp. JEL0837]
TSTFLPQRKSSYPDPALSVTPKNGLSRTLSSGSSHSHNHGASKTDGGHYDVNGRAVSRSPSPLPPYDHDSAWTGQSSMSTWWVNPAKATLPYEGDKVSVKYVSDAIVSAIRDEFPRCVYRVGWRALWVTRVRGLVTDRVMDFLVGCGVFVKLAFYKAILSLLIVVFGEVQLWPADLDMSTSWLGSLSDMSRAIASPPTAFGTMNSLSTIKKILDKQVSLININNMPLEVFITIIKYCIHDKMSSQRYIDLQMVSHHFRNAIKQIPKCIRVQAVVELAENELLFMEKPTIRMRVYQLIAAMRPNVSNSIPISFSAFGKSAENVTKLRLYLPRREKDQEIDEEDEPLFENFDGIHHLVNVTDLDGTVVNLDDNLKQCRLPKKLKRILVRMTSIADHIISTFLFPNRSRKETPLAFTRFFILARKNPSLTEVKSIKIKDPKSFSSVAKEFKEKLPGVNLNLDRFQKLFLTYNRIRVTDLQTLAEELRQLFMHVVELQLDFVITTKNSYGWASPHVQLVECLPCDEFFKIIDLIRTRNPTVRFLKFSFLHDGSLGCEKEGFCEVL